MTDKEVMQMVLDALESLQAWPETPENFKRFRAIEALRTALAQPEQYDQTELNLCKKSGCERENVKPEHEPVGRFAKFSDGIWKEVTDGSAGQPLYTTQQKKEWVGLTGEELQAIYQEAGTVHFKFAMVEAKLKEKNT